MSTLRELLKKGEQFLEKKNVPDAKNDAWQLLEFSFGIEKGYYFLHENDKIEKTQREKYQQLLDKRGERIPLQQITGSAWFMGYEFFVNDKVLIPRFDTEILVDEAGKLLRPGMSILDVCTGSGCIILSILAEHRDLMLRGAGVDISEDALLVAKENRKRLNVQAELWKSDLFSEVTGKFDVIVSNPPYICTKELEGLMPEVREHEPHLALDGKADGLCFYKKIVEQADEYLNPDGWLCFEIGWDQGEALYRMMAQAAYQHIEVKKDLAGLDRIVLGQKGQR